MADRAPHVAPSAEYVGAITDSRIWRKFRSRPGDVVVATPPKSGTTWTQGILALLFSGDPEVDANPSTNAPWIDNRLSDWEEKAARLAARTGRRQVKTHTPLDGIPLWRDLRYICVYRHPIDVHFSFRKHVANYRPELREVMGAGEAEVPRDARESFRLFLGSQGFDNAALAMIAGHYRSCRMAARHVDVLELHYADMVADLPGAVAKIAGHVGIDHPPELMEQIVDAARFRNMKANSGRFGLAVGAGLWKEDAAFFDSATSNKWEGVLTDEDLAAYDARISEMLAPEERAWLEWGNAGATAPR